MNESIFVVTITDPSLYMDRDECYKMSRPSFQLQHSYAMETIEASQSPEALSSIRDKAERLQEQINALRMEEITLSQQLNVLSPAYSLPYDILSRIFTHYYDLSPSRHCVERHIDYHWKKNKIWSRYLYDSPLKLGAVCSRWRQVANSIPHLWTSFNMEFCNCLDTIRSDVKISFLRRYFQRAQHLPLTLILNFGGSSIFYCGNDDEHNIKISVIKYTLGVILRDHAMYIRNLEIWGVVAGPWLPEIIQKTTLATLQSIRIAQTYNDNWSTTHNNLILPLIPTLQYLCLNAISLPGEIFICTNAVTRIHLANLSPDNALDLLIQCHETVVEYVYRRGHNTEVRIPLDYLVDFVIVFPCLQTFQWDFSCYHENAEDFSPCDTPILRNLDMPSLSNLQLSFSAAGNDLPSSPNSLTRLSHTLTTFRLFSPRAGWKAVLGSLDTHRLAPLLFEANEWVEMLKALEEESSVPSLTVLDLCDFLSGVSVENDSGEYEVWDDSDEVCTEVCDELISMLKSRTKFRTLKNEEEPFIIRLSDTVFEQHAYMTPQPWKDKCKEQIRILIDAGLVKMVELPPTSGSISAKPCSCDYWTFDD